MLCSLYAFFNLTFPPHRDSDEEPKLRPAVMKIYLLPSYDAVPNTDLSHHTHPAVSPMDDAHQHSDYLQKRIFWNGKRNKPNEKRSRVTFALLVCLGFAAFAVMSAVVGSAVVGYALAGLWHAGKYNMSTSVSSLYALLLLENVSDPFHYSWIPLFGGLIQSLVSILGYVLLHISASDTTLSHAYSLWPTVIDIV